jgi:hypothetical protein
VSENFMKQSKHPEQSLRLDPLRTWKVVASEPSTEWLAAACASSSCFVMALQFTSLTVERK